MAAATRVAHTPVDRMGRAMPSSTEPVSWRKIEDKVLEADLREWAARQEGKTLLQQQSKAIEVNLDVEKYEARLQSTSADDPDLVKLEAKLRKLRLQQEYLNELPPPQAARSRPGGSVEESGAGESNEAAPVMVMDVASSGRTSSKKGSSLCSVS